MSTQYKKLPVFFGPLGRGGPKRMDTAKLKAVAVPVPDPALVPAIEEKKGLKIALHLTDKDIEMLEQRSWVNGTIIKGIARRSGCTMDILPKEVGEESEDDRRLILAGTKITVSKGKAWVREFLTTTPKILRRSIR